MSAEEGGGGFAPLDGGDAGDAAEGAAEAAEESGTSPFSALLETEPDLSPTEEAESLGIGDAGGHAYVGLRKIVYHVSGADVDGGTPAIVNFGMAGILTYRDLEEPEESDEDDSPAARDEAEEVEWENDWEEET